MSSHPDVHLQEVVQKAHEELRQLLRQRVDITRRIGTARQTIAGLANLFGEGVLSDDLLELVDRKSKVRQPGLTQACRRILMEASKVMTVREVCDQIQQMVPPLLAGHKYPVAAVTTVLTRLVQYGEVRAVTVDWGHRTWQWVVVDRESIDAVCEKSPAQV